MVELLTEEDLAAQVKRLRLRFHVTTESTRSVYVLRLHSSAAKDTRALRLRTFPSGPYPPIVEVPKACVYVGVTALAVEERFQIHRSRGGKASKVAKLGFIDEGDFATVGKEFTEAYGLSAVGWKDGKPEKAESWVAWKLYCAGYWVWGSHLHERLDFLGAHPFE
jgi:hypothetical protein